MLLEKLIYNRHIKAKHRRLNLMINDSKAVTTQVLLK